MNRSFIIAMAAIAAVGVLPTRAAGQEAPLAGAWTLNRTLSDLPREIGFNASWLPALPAPGTSGQTAGSAAGARGRRGGGSAGNAGSAGPFSSPNESSEDAKRVQLLTGEARNPPVRLVVADTLTAVTLTNQLGQSRVLHPDGRQESIDIQGVPAAVTTKRDADRLIVLYYVEPDRELRYTYSHTANPPQLIVDVQFLEHGSGDRARLVYEPGTLAEARATSAPAALDSRPGAELRGLKNIGILVEDLSAQATACGLNHDALEAGLATQLTNGGFVVRKNSDEDTYLYVNVMTNTLSDGTCLSRYDAFLYTHAAANLSFRDQPVLVQVSLMHRGGIGSSVSAGHAGAVSRALAGYVDLFVTQIHDANK